MPLPVRLQQFVDESATLDKLTRSMLLIDYAAGLGDYPEDKKDDVHRVRGCTSLVYLDADFDETEGVMHFCGFADAQIVEAIVAVDPTFILDAGLGEALSVTRQGGLANILNRMQNAARANLEPSA